MTDLNTQGKTKWEFIQCTLEEYGFYLVRYDMDVNEHERLSNIFTLRRRLKYSNVRKVFKIPKALY
jgi:hypothetical protein